MRKNWWSKCFFYITFCVKICEQIWPQPCYICSGNILFQLVDVITLIRAVSRTFKRTVHWGLGIRTSTITVPYPFMIHIRILFVQYGYREPSLYGYRDSLGIGTSYSTYTVTEASFVRIPRPVTIPIPRPVTIAIPIWIPRPQCIWALGVMRMDFHYLFLWSLK